MALTFPRDEFMEMFFPSLGWVDVTSQIRQTDPVTIARGRANEQGKVAPARLSAVMKNDTGDFSPGNPMGDYYGQLGRNTPVQFGVGLARDTFSRVVVDGLGSTDTGEAWTLSGTAANFDVGGSSATVSVAAATSAHYGYLPAFAAWEAYEVTATITVTTPAGIAPNRGGLVYRGSTISDAWRLMVAVANTGVATLEISDGAGTVHSFVALAGSGAFRVRVLVDNNTILGKAWLVAAPVPYDWQVSHAATAGLNAAGWMGIRAANGNGTGAANVVTVDNFTVRTLRFSGEISELKPRWNENHKVKWANLEAAGILRRLEQGKKPLRPAAHRFITGSDAPFTLVDYWPLELGPAAADPAASENGGAPGVFERETGILPNTGAVKFGADPGALISVSGAAELTNGGRLTMPVRNATLGSSYSVTWVQRLSADAGGKVFLHNTNPDQDVTLIFFTDGAYQVFLATSDPFNPVLLFSGSIAGIGFDDVWHAIGFSAYNAGGSVVGFALSIDGTFVTNAVSATTFATIKDAMAYVPNATTGAGSYGQVTVFPERIDLADRAALISDAMFGHIGESAGRRAERLCDEEDIPFTYVGDLDDTEPMGPQRPGTLMELLQECADADQGTLYESRGVIGLALRTRGGTENQAAALTLNYAAKHIGDSPEPTHDDQNTRNDVTATRLNGGEYRAVQESGPLNVNDPGTDPDGVGRNDDQVTVNVEADSQLRPIAERLVARGTVPGDRYPRIKVNLRASAITNDSSLGPAIMAVDIDDRLVVTNLSAADVFESIDQVARGYTEVFADRYHHDITFNASPYLPYRVFVLDTSRLTGDESTLTSGISNSALSWQVSTSGGTLWTTAAGDFPMTILIGGERITLSGISGSSSPQTFTASARSVNGVSKSHLAGAAVIVADPDYLG